ncbi:MAG: hypothetical protein ABIL39_10620 [candidate division WOR-3 bacterium]
MLSKKQLSVINGVSLSFLIYIICLSTNASCKNPKEYEPPFDSLHPPPAAPILISPRNDTTIWFTTPYPHEIKLKWSVVEDVEYYQLQIANDTTVLPNAPLINAEACSTIYTITKNGFYFWHVRAYNRKWTWYTEWSPTWHFGVFYAP